MQPPPSVITPIVPTKPKVERRQRKPATSRPSAAKSRNGKGKGAAGSPSASATNAADMSAQPHEGIVRPYISTSTNSNDITTPPNNFRLGVMHPALKDADLSQLSQSASLPNDLSNQETVNSLLASLIGQSTSNTSLSEATTPPQPSHLSRRSPSAFQTSFPKTLASDDPNYHMGIPVASQYSASSSRLHQVREQDGNNLGFPTGTVWPGMVLPDFNMCSE